MITVTLTIKNPRDYKLFIELANRLDIDVPVSSEDENQKQMQTIYKLLDSIEKDDLFREIEDPLNWQKELRDEWA